MIEGSSERRPLQRRGFSGRSANDVGWPELGRAITRAVASCGVSLQAPIFNSNPQQQDGMSGIMSGPAPNEAFLSASSSSNSHSPAANTPTSDDRDELDFLDADADADLHDDSDLVHDPRHGFTGDAAVLADDPIHGDLGTPLSFKRRPKQSLLSAPSRFLSSLMGTASPHLENGSPDLSRAASPGINAPGNLNVNASTKDGISLDWYVEGPGRRVGYEDLTAIDWIFEYTKERQRLRVLASSASGLFGYAQHLLDASQIWIILLLTGLTVGAIAAGIDITTDWLGDLKLGFCSSGPEGGQFYLSKGFCCYGYDQGSKCEGWKSWSDALGISSAGGSWFIEYFFYLIFSVCLIPTWLVSLC